MLLRGCVLSLICGIAFGQGSVKYNNFTDTNVDPVSLQLFQFRDTHKKPIGLLTTRQGAPVDVTFTNTINRDLLSNQFFYDSLVHAVFERIPEREVFTKGTGAFGYFEVTHDVTKYTKAKVFEQIGKKTPLVARFATSQIDKGGSDTNPVAVRGFSIKMYTEEGNLDFLNIQIPIYLYRDPVLFPSAVHAVRKNAKTNFRDFSQGIDFLSLSPTSLYSILWTSSEFGLPRGFRYMNAFPVHTYEIYNEHGQSFFVKFKFLTELGFRSFTLQEAQLIGATDPDFFSRDLYNAIELKKYPSWRLEMDVLNQNIEDIVDFDPFDVTSIWPNGTYYTVPIGRVVLNKNVDNFFADTEQAAFNPNHLVPGIVGPHDQIFRGRVIAYTTAHIHRLGPNSERVKVNQPKCFRSYDRDGLPPVDKNGGDGPNYFPNTFNGPIPYVDPARPKYRPLIRESTAVDFEKIYDFYNRVLQTDAQKQRLVDTLVLSSLRVPKEMTDRFIKLLSLGDKALGERYAVSLEIAKRTIKLPNMVEDLPSPKP